MTTALRPTVKQLRAEIESVGITEEMAGMPIDDLIRLAREQEEPSQYLVDMKKEYLEKTAAAAASPPPPEVLAEQRMEAEGGAPVEAAADAAPSEQVFNAVPPPAAAEPLRRFESGRIAVPVGEIPEDLARQGKFFISRHLEVQLTFEQAANLRRIAQGLDAAGEKLANGKHVVRNGDAVRWMLEHLERIS